MAARAAAAVALSVVLLLVAANALIPLALGIFAKGFFPYKPLLPGLAQYDEDAGHGLPAVAAPFDRVVFMVVDALRSDFVYVANSGFEFTQSLIRSGAALPFTAHATAPTVTMPRIKAITTGSIPSFLDVVLNVDEGDQSSSLASQDSWLAQMKAKAAATAAADGSSHTPPRKLVLYGDDTWLKLFPDTFDRADGTSSFFVADFTEVDHNVTRHVAGELRRDDWSVLVLHYLGLDHIGHKGGPRSPHMVPKQREMDGIVRQLYAALAAEPHLASTLLVLCGDHGMNDAGNHGASSAGETSPALLFVAPKLQTVFGPAAAGGSVHRPSGIDDNNDRTTAPLAERDDFQFYHTVEQSDVAPTLGALLGFPAPKNNLGAFIPDLLPLWPDRRDHVRILLHNARQILQVLTAAFGAEAFAPDASAPTACGAAAGPQTDVEALGCEWQALACSVPVQTDDTVDVEAYDEWIARAIKWLRDAQQTMSGMASNYDLPKMGFGLAAAGSALIFAVAASYLLFAPMTPNSGKSTARVLAVFAAVCVAYGVMMFASSYVEEEHHFWYWAATAYVAHLGFRSVSEVPTFVSSRPRARVAAAAAAALSALVAVRLLRAWNQTGQKFAGEPDVVKTFLQPHPLLLWALVVSTYAWLGYRLVCGLAGGGGATAGGVSTAVVAGPAVFLLVAAAFSFKLVFTLEDSPELVGPFAPALASWVARFGGGNGVTLVTRARLVFAGLAVATVGVVYRMLTRRPGPSPVPPMEPLLHLYSLLGVTQSRTTNIPLFLVFGVVYSFLARRQTRQRNETDNTAGLIPAEITTATLLLQFAAFFAFGGTNAISSVDLSSAYNGIAGFSAGAVGVLLFLSNWAGSIYWTVAATLLLLLGDDAQVAAAAAAGPARPTRPVQRSVAWLQHVALLTVFAAASVVAVMAACTALRTHLFVWTVFSPKYLYCAAWSLGMHLGVNVGFGGLLYWLGTLSQRRSEQDGKEAKA
ncbi:Alkaline-phosphatase-like, core domain protein [Niveomyces insectorum RCEF 264]|uniref:GPI ethanolamine phosphate transferase 2 n=1 Tax=Niveomyces insectorum RCEF 264 TaxID=1081102 RepID=A0A167NI62_9HYPO|nr:Alkaline-phosphatase-like, core domain protein [Niveomyces insectorum RCEF 264]